LKEEQLNNLPLSEASENGYLEIVLINIGLKTSVCLKNKI
jgi:hypothetical protein